MNRSSATWRLAPFLALALGGTAYSAAIENPPVQSICGLDPTDGDLGSTCRFMTANANGTGVPISARTDFIENWDAQVDGLTLATHELFHAIGFTVNYADFAAKLIATPGAGANGIPAGSRSYSTNGLAGGILLTLTASNQGTHADPNTTGAAPWPATGYNQANDVMQPEQPGNAVRTLSNTDFNVLANAFGWNNTGIKFVINNIGGTLDDTDINLIANAAAAITAHYGTFANSPTFTWDVAEAVPEPATWPAGFLAAGLILFAAARRVVAA